MCGGLDFWGASVCGGLLAILDFGGLVCLSHLYTILIGDISTEPNRKEVTLVFHCGFQFWFTVFSQERLCVPT